MPRRHLSALVGALTVMLFALPASAIFHTFKIVEVYRSPDGSAEFIELREVFGFAGQNIFAGQTLVSTNADGSRVRTFTFPNNLPSSATASKRVLIARQGFGSLVGGVAPDYTLTTAAFPQGFLFPEGGTVNFAFGTSQVTYGPPPTDGVSSLNASGAASSETASVQAVNTPTNFAGAAGSVNVGAPTGRCCANGACSTGVQSACGGTWLQGATCASSPCATPTGVCCRGSTCAAGAAAACTGPNTAFVSGASACNASGVVTSPCCKADYNKTSGVELLDIFAFLDGWFAGSADADFTGLGGVDLLDIFGFLEAWFAGAC